MNNTTLQSDSLLDLGKPTINRLLINKPEQ